jgi:hypothetical protein
VSELTIESDGLRVSISVAADVDLWPVASAAFQAAREASTGRVIRKPATPKTMKAADNMSERVREVAKGVLADGRQHERREIAKAVREAGLSIHVLDSALASDPHLEKRRNGDDRPAFVDHSVPSGYEPPPEIADEDKPEWMRDPVPGEWAGATNGDA